jgi:hypothetical protein
MHVGKSGISSVDKKHVHSFVLSICSPSSQAQGDYIIFHYVEREGIRTKTFQNITEDQSRQGNLHKSISVLSPNLILHTSKVWLTSS